MSEVKNREIYERVASLETNVQNIQEDIVTIRDNHLVHIAADIKELNKQVVENSGKIKIAVAVVTVLWFMLQVGISYFFK